MYDAGVDPYCYAGTEVLKNTRGFRDPIALERFEAVSVAQRASESLPLGRLSVAHYCAFHRHLFRDVYRWAGRFRTVRLSKGGSVFCYPENISAQMRQLFEWLRVENYLRDRTPQEFAAGAAHFLAELNAIHPFREGNGRTQLAFLIFLAARAGHPLNTARLDPPLFLEAMIRSFQGDEAPVARQLSSLL